MADEDLIFRLEGVDGGPTSGAGHSGDSDADSDDEEGYFIYPLTDDPRTHQNGHPKVNDYCSDLVKREQYSFNASPGSSFNFRVSRPLPPRPRPRPPTGQMAVRPSGALVGSFLCYQTGQRCELWV